MDGLAFSNQPPESKSPPPRELLSQTEFAKRLGVSDAAVSKAKATGRFPARCWQGKKLIWSEARAAWYQSADTRGGRRGVDVGTLPPTVDAAQQQAEAESLRAIKRQREQVELEKAQLELAYKQDALRPKDDVERAFTTIARTARDQIDAVITWATELSALTGHDVVELRAFLKIKARKLQSEMAETFRSLPGDDENEEETAVDD